MKGYRLHDERIAYSGGTESMRSIKYELVDTPRTSGLKSLVAEAITHDYTCLYGPLNFSDYLAGQSGPSLLDFWLKALSLGFVFSNQNVIEKEFLDFLGKRTIWQQGYDSLSPDLRNVIDEQSFCEFIIIPKRFGAKNDDQLKKIIFGLAKKDADTAVLAPIADTWSKGCKAATDQQKFKCEVFGVAEITKPKRTLKLSYAIDPSFAVMDTNDRTKLMDDIISYYHERCSAEQAKKFLAIGNKGSYFNGLLGNLLSDLQNGREVAIADLLCDIYEMPYAHQDILHRLSELKKVASQIGEPKLVKAWSDYRIDFNGTIESWYSNRASKQQTVLEQLDGTLDKKTGERKGGLKFELQQLYQALPDDNEIKEVTLTKTITVITDHTGSVDRTFTDELESNLATLRTNLNEWSQHHKDVALPKDWQKTLHKRPQSSPLFFGENKTALWKQLINLKQLIRTDIQEVLDFTKSAYEDYEITDKQVDMLAQLAQRISEDGNATVKERLQRIELALGVKFRDRTDRARYYVSGYERTVVKQLEVPHRLHISALAKIADLPDLYIDAAQTPQVDNALRDSVQLSKIIASAMARGGQRQPELTRLHTYLSGYANLLSKQVFIERSTVMAENGKQVTLAVRDNKYFYAFSPAKFSERDEAWLFDKTYSFTASELREKTDAVPLLAVQSSRYQVQFLEWFMGKHKRKKTSLSAGGAFSIAERTVRLSWHDDKPTVVSVSEPRVFVSQPFEIIPKHEGKQTPDNRFIGIDIGEYGLAWMLIEVQGQQVHQLESGFIADAQQHVLKNTVKRFRETQVQATFTSPDTRVARIRESLIGSYRNQLEELAMCKGARLGFEYDVDAFETGGARVSKVYASIKRGDVKKKDNKAENEMAWGRGGVDNWGVETVAAGTSRACTKCKRWADTVIDKNKKYIVASYDDGLYRAALPDGNVRFLGKKAMSDTIPGTDLSRLIYKAMRPNEDGLGMEIVKRNTDWSVLGNTFGAGKPRGNIGIYVCPYVDCHHIADADMQAAFNIAIRSFIHYNSEGKIRTAKDFVAAATEYNFNPVGFTSVRVS